MPVLVQLTAIIGLLVVQTVGFPRPSLSPAPNADQCFAKRKAIEGLLPFSRRLSGEIYTVHSNVSIFLAKKGATDGKSRDYGGRTRLFHLPTKPRISHKDKTEKAVKTLHYYQNTGQYFLSLMHNITKQLRLKGTPAKRPLLHHLRLVRTRLRSLTALLQYTAQLMKALRRFPNTSLPTHPTSKSRNSANTFSQSAYVPTRVQTAARPMTTASTTKAQPATSPLSPASTTKLQPTTNPISAASNVSQTFTRVTQLSQSRTTPSVMLLRFLLHAIEELYKVLLNMEVELFSLMTQFAKCSQ